MREEWQTTRYENDSDGNAIYKGLHTNYKASTSDKNWLITKYTYSGDNVEQKDVRTTSWDDRAIGW